MLVSVIIPTRNRQKYAYGAVKSILSYNKDIEIIVTDNSDDSSLKSMLSLYENNKCLKYFYFDERISVVDNYNAAAELAQGEYICAIGDDDTVLPNIVQCADWMKRNNIDAVLPFKRLSYYWHIDGISRSALLEMFKCSGKLRRINTYQGVIELLENGGQDYLQLPLACTYHGIVKKSVFDKVKKITGRYYGGLSSDIYSSVCLSLLDNIKVVKMDYPITLPGVCNESTSADSMKNSHFGELKDAPHFIGLSEPYLWDDLIPSIYSVNTIWCETMIKAIKSMGCQELIDKYFNRKCLIDRIYYDNFEHRETVLKLLSDSDKKLIENKEVTKPQKVDRLLNIKIYIYRLLRLKFEYYHCNDIEKAALFVSSVLNTRRYKKIWTKIINTEI